MELFRIHSLDPDHDPLEAARPAVQAEPASPPIGRADSAPADRAMELPVTRRSAESDVSLVVAQLNALLEERHRQLEAATRRAAGIQNLLGRLADELCPAALDEERRKLGAHVDEWPPERFVALVVNNIRDRLLRADQAARQHATLTQAYAALLTEHQRLQNDPPKATRDEPAVGSAPEPPSVVAAVAPVVKPTVTADPPIRSSTARPRAPRGLPPVTSDRIDEVVRVMAVTGLVRGPRIREELSALWRIDRRDAGIGQVMAAVVAQGYARLRPVRAEWRGAPTQFVELAEAGVERALSLGCSAPPNEMSEGLRRQLSLEMISLVLQAVEVLNNNRYTDVTAFPRPVKLPDGPDYVPLLSARDHSANTLYVECEREKVLLPRDERWRLAAKAGGETVHLVTTSQARQAALTSEINLIRVTQPFRLKALNLDDYEKGKRSPDHSIWIYNR